MTTHVYRGLGVLAGLVLSVTTEARPPVLYHQFDYQSPVRAEPDDLLLLPGAGFESGDHVVYVALEDTTAALTPPEAIPAQSTATIGVAPIVSRSSAPYSITVRLPSVMSSGQSYALWVAHAPVTPGAKLEWSNGVRINDARPMWVTPAQVFATQSAPGLERYVKVVGRSLQPTPGGATRIRFTGPETFALVATAESTPDAGGAIDRYVARAALPARLRPGSYSIDVSRDGRSWVPLEDQKWIVLPDAATAPTFAPTDCTPDDSADDTACIASAIRAAAEAGGGTVVLGPGSWDLINGGSKGAVAGDGITVPPGVNLRGVSSRTRVIRHDRWNVSTPTPIFTLLGRNVVSGITFVDERVFRAGDEPQPALLLGRMYHRIDRANPKQPLRTEDVTITNNVFDKPYAGIADGGLPIRRLTITHNVIGGFSKGIELGGNGYNTLDRFGIEDAIITHNTFRPGAYFDPRIGQGAMASEIGASRRMDFSQNVADGTSVGALYSTRDPRGWRAAFFWHLMDNQEHMLVSQNVATCTGDKLGDGEAIAFDGNQNTFAFDRARDVLGGDADTIVVAGPLRAKQRNKPIDIARYYVGHWLQIADGPGAGQARKIVAYDIDAGSGRVSFKVAPAWDVLPGVGKSRVTIARTYWQVFTVDNIVDHRTPLCAKSNRTLKKGGGLGMWSQTTDAVMEGNRQYDTDGIIFQQAYSAEDPRCPECTAWTSLQSSVEIRGNLIDGEYDWSSDCSHSGIQASHAASPTPGSPPPVTSFGVSISHNTIRHADSLRGGAIAVPPTWFQGPAPSRWPMVESLLIHHNTITDLTGPVPLKQCDHALSGRVGINLYQADLVWRTTLYANSCVRVGTKLRDMGRETVRVCPSSAADSCECSK